VNRNGNNIAEVETEHFVAGHKDEAGRWHMECHEDGWRLDTEPNVSEDELDALIDVHLAT
jgi:hypothetical protein